jgi:hypothetical protein
LKWPRGENLGLQDRARGLVRYPQPRHLLLGGQRQLLDRVHLPDFVGLTAPFRFGGAGPARPRRREVMTAQPALDGARARQRLAREQVGQLDVQAPRPPAGALGMKLEHGRHQGGRGRRLVASAGLVAGEQSRGPLSAEALKQGADGTLGQAQAPRDGRGGDPLAGQAEHGLANGGSVRTRHGTPEQSDGQVSPVAHPTSPAAAQN